MKIAFVLTQSLDSPSGLGRYGPIARELVKLGYEVELIALHPSWQQLSQKSFIEQGVQVNYVGQMHVQKVGSRKIYFSPAKLLWVALIATIRLARAVTRSNADIIHVGKPQPFNLLAARYGRRGRPIYCDCDDYEAETNKFSSGWQKKIVRYFEDSIVHFAEGLTVNTRFLQERYRELGFPASKIHVVPNGIEQSRFIPTRVQPNLVQKWQLHSEAPIILYIGTLGLLSHPVDLLLEAFVLVQKEVANAQLLLVGGGEDFDTLQQLAVELGVAKQVIFTGRLQPEEIPAYLALATVTVDPVRDDLIAKARSPLKIVESLSMGVPVVTSNVGDRVETLDYGKLGVLVPPGSASSLANGILTLVQQPKLRAKMSSAALQKRNHWFWERLVTDFVKVYEG